MLSKWIKIYGIYSMLCLWIDIQMIWDLKLSVQIHSMQQFLGYENYEFSHFIPHVSRASMKSACERSTDRNSSKCISFYFFTPKNLIKMLMVCNVDSTYVVRRQYVNGYLPGELLTAFDFLHVGYVPQSLPSCWW